MWNGEVWLLKPGWQNNLSTEFITWEILAHVFTFGSLCAQSIRGKIVHTAKNTSLLKTKLNSLSVILTLLASYMLRDFLAFHIEYNHLESLGLFSFVFLEMDQNILLKVSRVQHMQPVFPADWTPREITNFLLCCFIHENKKEKVEWFLLLRRNTMFQVRMAFWF